MLIIGCVRENSEFTITPDGSGKVIYEATFIPEAVAFLNIDFDTADNKDVNVEEAKNAVVKILREPSGIDAWKEVNYNVTDYGNVHFRGTAFFIVFDPSKIEF